METIYPTYKDSREEYKAAWLSFVDDKYTETIALSQEALETARAESVSLIESLQDEIETLQITVTNNLYYGIFYAQYAPLVQEVLS